MLFFSRGLSGMGAGGINALVLIMVGDLTSAMKESKRRKCQACLETLVVIGNGLGPVIAGAVAERASWRWTFWLLVPLTVVSGVVVAALMPGVKIAGDWKEKITGIDYAGTLTSIGAILLFLVSIIKDTHLYHRGVSPGSNIC
jgi:MFS family permease